MSTRDRLRVVVVGSQTLTQACTEKVIGAGGEIVGVITSASNFSSWCRANRIPLVSWPDLSGLSFDYLLSIVHLEIIPSKYLEYPKFCSINFHDGPLSEYRGLNTPMWAIVNREKRYGITWHVVEPKVDSGAILVRRDFELDADETALTLNTKCFNEGLFSFDELLEKLSDPAFSIDAPVDPPGRLFLGHDLPSNGGWIQWDQNAEDIEAMFRALDFGAYDNPACLPKILVKDRPFIARSAAIGEGVSTTPPGTLIAATNNNLRVSTATNDISIFDVTTPSGKPVRLRDDLELREGDRFLPLADSHSQALKAHARKIRRSDPTWRAVYQGLQPVEVPYEESATNSQLSEQRVSAGNFRSADAMALVVLYLARLSRLEEFDVWLDDPWESKYSPIQPSVLTTVPTRIRPDWSATVDEWLTGFSQTLSRLTTIAPPYVDLLLRDSVITEATRNQALEDPTVTLHRGAPSAGALEGRLSIWVDDECAGLTLRSTVMSEASLEKIGRELELLFGHADSNPRQLVSDVPIVLPQDLKLLEQLNDTGQAFQPECIHRVIDKVGQEQPTRDAVACGDHSLTFEELGSLSGRVAENLVQLGVEKGDRVAIHLHRTIHLIPCLLGVMKAGAVYVPIDPDYPVERIQHILADSQIRFAISDDEIRAADLFPETVAVVTPERATQDSPSAVNLPEVTPADLIYTIYTSGSSGMPKGVNVRHENVYNFFAGMDERIEHANGTLVAATSISFDISVLELFWSLSRGFKVVVQQDEALATASPGTPMEFGLFYWNLASSKPLDGNPYDLLLRGAQYADENQFSSIWIPERHFGSFGGLYPNPSVVGAALAARTKNIAIRAGSCVLPLHNPIRVAEEWAVVDNLSQGRVAVSMAAGWMPNDFVLMPENFENKKEKMFENIEVVRKLWSGEELTFKGPRGDVPVRTLPRPVQKELPIWVTSAGNVETYERAAEIGANILTHLLGQSISDVGEKVKRYREVWESCGHPGKGTVTLMLHTFVGPTNESVKDIVREPMKTYLKSSLSLIKDAAWEFSTFKKFSAEGERTLDEYFAQAPDSEVNEILEFAFERYYENNSLLGDVEKCVAFVDKLKQIEVDEIGCLIDFGVEDERVVKHLRWLNEVRVKSNQSETEVLSILENISTHKASHFQCTPTMMSMLLWDPEAKKHLQSLEHIMVGGEPVTQDLVNRISGLSEARIHNMYGPTETTIWSTTCELHHDTDVSIGLPIVNTQLAVIDHRGHQVPTGVVGELAIAGSGVTSGYHNREELNGRAFCTLSGNSEVYYKTGDLVRLNRDGSIRFLHREDHQVKVRGYRIELGEIESVANQHQDIVESAALIEGSESSDASIILCVVTSKTTVKADVQAFLEQKLPLFMIPNHIVTLMDFPKLPNGKLDRRKLLSLAKDRAIRTDLIEPKTRLEKVIAEIWEGLTGTSQISTHDSFFEIGGHSLSAVQAIMQIRDRTGVDLNPRIILSTTLEQIALECERRGASTESERTPPVETGSKRGLVSKLLGIRFGKQ